MIKIIIEYRFLRMDNREEIVNKENENNILNMDMNILQNISTLTFSKFMKDIYRDIIKLYNVDTHFKKIITTILIEDDCLLLDIISYIHLIDKEVNFYSNEFIDLFSKWNNYKEYRVQNQNIYIYLNTIKRKKCMVSGYDEKSSKLNINNFNNLGITLANCKDIRQIPQQYKDKNNLINDINVAYNHIQNNNKCVYKENISVELYDYSKLENFELLCVAIRKHITLYKQMVKLYSIYIMPEQILALVKNNHNIYKSLSSNNKKRTDIIEEVILNSKNAYNIMKDNLRILHSNYMLNILYNLTEKYNLNNKENSVKNKNYIYFILNYITSQIVDNNKKTQLKDNVENNNDLFGVCYNKLKYYIENTDYRIFEIDNVEINFSNVCVYNSNFTTNHRWKYYEFCEEIDISLKKIADEIYKIIKSDRDCDFKIEEMYHKNIINIYYLNIIYQKLNKVKIYYYDNTFRTPVLFKNYHPLLKELFTQLLGNIDDNQQLYFYDIMKKHYLPELNKLETIEHEVNWLLH